jgi:putative DNA methylase
MIKPYKKKLIEIAIPLEAINAASVREKSIRHGHPSTLHLWWARRPLATCRAILFAQLVDDPSSHPEQFPTHQDQERERQRLFTIIEDLVKWENSANEEVLERARAEIRRCCGGTLPPVYDPFSGGGSIPLEAQRLGLPAYGSDLNPVAVMIGKAMIEIPPYFKDMPPIHPGIKERSFYRNAEGLAEDVKYYGEWMRKKAWERIGHLYPQVDLPKALGGGKARVIAWIWARTIPSPNPALPTLKTPLVRSFYLLDKENRKVWVEPVINADKTDYQFEVCHGTGPVRQPNISRSGANCVVTGEAIPLTYIRQAAQSGKMGQRLMAVVVETTTGRNYISPTPEMEQLALHAEPVWCPETLIPIKHRNFQTPLYGMRRFGDVFTNRQLAALNTFVDVLKELEADIAPEFESGAIGRDVQSYIRALRVYLSFAISKALTRNCSLAIWESGMGRLAGALGRQALPMQWTFAETNPFAGAGGDIAGTAFSVSEVLDCLTCTSKGTVIQHNASEQNSIVTDFVLSTDPPYYDNIEYAELSDFFYGWLQKILRDDFPEIMGVISVPKREELVASTTRHGSSEAAEAHFMNGMTQAMRVLSMSSSNNYPAAIYYAFKQSEIEQDGISSPGWSSFLEAVISSGFIIVGTWPVRTEATNALKKGMNALANSVVLVCRKKVETAEVVTRAEFIRALKRELAPAIAELQAANIAPADIPQSAIGPGMGVFSRYKSVLESDDSPMSVKAALQLINRELDEYLGGIQGEFDPDTRFAVTWFEQHGMAESGYGTADNLARARGISVESVKHAGIIESAAGKVRLLARHELDHDWEPEGDDHLTVWECLQYLVRKHETEGISHQTAILLKSIGTKADAVKDLAYCLYDISANKRKDAKEATAYNALIADWAELTRHAASIHGTSGDRQARLDI